MRGKNVRSGKMLERNWDFARKSAKRVQHDVSENRASLCKSLKEKASLGNRRTAEVSGLTSQMRREYDLMNNKNSRAEAVCGKLNSSTEKIGSLDTILNAVVEKLRI